MPVINNKTMKEVKAQMKILEYVLCSKVMTDGVYGKLEDLYKELWIVNRSINKTSNVVKKKLFLSLAKESLSDLDKLKKENKELFCR